MAWFWLLIFPVMLVATIVVWGFSDTPWTWLVTGLASIVLILSLTQGCGYKPALKHSEEYRTFTVTHKERTGGDNGKWLVFSNDGVFSVEDSLWLFKFDASDRYNHIKVGHTYRCKVAGWRIHFTSDYENLISCKELS